MEKEIREILSPHFGYLKLYLKWSEECGVSKIREFHNYLKSNKNITNKLPKQLNQYKSYYQAMSDIYKIQKDINIQRAFKDGLNSKSRKFFIDTYKDYKKTYWELFENKFKFDMFLRSSSKPQTKGEFVNYLSLVSKFDTEMKGIIDRIENSFDYVRTKSGAYLFQLNKSMLDIVPSIWCIKNDEQQFGEYKLDFNSIWLLIDPFNINPNRRMVGIDVCEDLSNILYMDSLNNRFTDDVPITKNDFFHLTRSRLPKKVEDTNDIGKVLEDNGLDVNELVKKIMDNELEMYKTYQENIDNNYNNKVYDSIKRIFDNSF